MSAILPNLIPVFPLSGVIYFPKTNLPLNIFERRYLDLVNDVVKKDKLMGMIQSRKENDEIYKVGCLGKISDFKRSEDGRILINLVGVSRFEILEEKTNSKLYREFKVDYEKFKSDTKPIREQLEMEILMKKAQNFFNKNGLLLNWNEFEKLENTQKIDTLAMIAPITNEEKQKLLECITFVEKIKTLSDIINFYLYSDDIQNLTVQ